MTSTNKIEFKLELEKTLQITQDNTEGVKYMNFINWISLFCVLELTE